MKKIIILLLTSLTPLVSLTMQNAKPTCFFISDSKDKYNELKSIMPEIELYHLDVDLTPIQETNPTAFIQAQLNEAYNNMNSLIIKRNQKGFKNNEKEKFAQIAERMLTALQYKKASIIVENTSLYINALNNKKANQTVANGLPGPLTKWFMNTMGNDGLSKLADTFGNDATVATCIGYSDGKTINILSSEVAGKIVKPTKSEDVSWDPIFQPNGSQTTLAQMAPEEKKNYSTFTQAAALLLNLVNNTHKN